MVRRYNLNWGAHVVPMGTIAPNTFLGACRELLESGHGQVELLPNKGYDCTLEI